MEVFRGATRAGFATAFSGFAQQPTLSLGGLQEIRLIGFGNAEQRLSLNGCRGGKEAMTPAKRRTFSGDPPSD